MIKAADIIKFIYIISRLRTIFSLIELTLELIQNSRNYGS